LRSNITSNSDSLRHAGEVISSLSQLPSKLEVKENLPFWFSEDIRGGGIDYSDLKPLSVGQQAQPPILVP
jgi:hypothetical protein